MRHRRSPAPSPLGPVLVRAKDHLRSRAPRSRHRLVHLAGPMLMMAYRRVLTRVHLPSPQRLLLPKMLQIGLHIPQPQAAPSLPPINRLRDPPKPPCMTPTMPRLKPTPHKQIRVNQLMQERRDQQPPIILRVRQDRATQHNERLVPAIARLPQRRRPDDPAAALLRLAAGEVHGAQRPLPLHAARQPVLEEERVRGAEDALERRVVELEVAATAAGRGVVRCAAAAAAAAPPRIDERAEDPLVAARAAAGAGEEVLLDAGGGVVVVGGLEVWACGGVGGG